MNAQIGVALNQEGKPVLMLPGPVADIQQKLFLLGLLQAGVMMMANVPVKESGIVLAGAPLPNGGA